MSIFPDKALLVAFVYPTPFYGPSILTFRNWKTIKRCAQQVAKASSSCSSLLQQQMHTKLCVREVVQVYKMHRRCIAKIKLKLKMAKKYKKENLSGCMLLLHVKQVLF